MPPAPVDQGGDALNTWQSQHVEEPLDPNQPIIDAHHHLWEWRGMPYNPSAPSHSRYTGDDLVDDINRAGHRIVDTVYVECLSMYRAEGGPLASCGEVEFAQGVAAMAASNFYGKGIRCCGAIVGHVDLTQDPSVVGSALDALMKSSHRFRGIRHAHSFDDTREAIPSHHKVTRHLKHLLMEEKFRKGFAELDVRGLVFDCWGYHTQLSEVADLARSFPSTTIVVNHLGGPLGVGPYKDDREGTLTVWRRGLFDVAKCPNVVMKLGGAGMPFYGFGFGDTTGSPPTSAALADAWGPCIETIVEMFGPSRCMFESNFPVDKVSCSYGALWNAFQRVATERLRINQVDRNFLFYGTAARVYRMPLTPELEAGLSIAKM